MTPSLVLLPGLGCDAALWRWQVPALHARGHGTHITHVHARATTLEAMADALLAECEAALGHRQPVVLVGASLGAMVAMHAALKAPARVAGLALLGTTARADSPAMQALRGAAALRFEQGDARQVLETNLPMAFHPLHPIAPALREAYLAMVLRAGGAQLAQQNRAAMARPDLRGCLAAIACPTLVMVGDGDTLTPPSAAQEIADAVAQGGADVRHVLVKDAGHMLMWEQPEAVNQTLLAWLAESITPPPKHTSPS